MSFSKPSTPGSRPPCALPSEAPSKSFWHSEPSPLLTAHRTTRELPAAADVVVIGSGMTGTSVAHHLLNDGSPPRSTGWNEGTEVLMLEAREACWGATGRNGGHCQPLLFAHPHDPSIGHFELANFRALQALIAARNIDCEFVVQPSVHAFYSRSACNDAELALLAVQANAPSLAALMALVTDQAQLAALRVPGATGALVTSTAARMWPYKFVSRVLEELLLAPGLEGRFNLQTFTPVEALVQTEGEGWIVRTPRGSVTAKQVVLATNAYTSHLLPCFADLIVPVRGQMSALVPLPSVAGDNRVKNSMGFDGEAIDEYLIQRPNERGGHLMYGGGRQIGGKTVGVADDSVIDDEIATYLRKSLIERCALPEGYEERVVSARCDRCVRRKVKCWRPSGDTTCTPCARHDVACTTASSLTKPTELDAVREWTGIMGYSRDEHPWVGPVPGKSNLFMSAGYTGHGMPNTWLCGKAVARMVQSDMAIPQTPLDVTASVPERMRRHTEEWCRKLAARVASKEVGLPESYLVTEERLKKALEQREDVGMVDWAEMERARRRQRADRVPSGYA